MKAGFAGWRAGLLLMSALAVSVPAGIDIQVTGNHFLGGREIKEVLPEDPAEFSEDATHAWREDASFYASELYKKSGFFDVRVNVDLGQKKDSKDWQAAVTVTEGERYRFDSVRVVAMRDSSGAAADTTFRFAPGDLDARADKPYLEDALFLDRRVILQRYGDAGYTRAKVDDKRSVNPEGKTVAVTYVVETSYPVVFDTLILRDWRTVYGNLYPGLTREDLLRSLVPYGRGDTVSATQSDRVIEKLQYTGVFHFTRLKDSLLSDRDHRSALILQTEERIPGNLRSSVFYETQYGPGISVDARHGNVAGTMNEARTGAALAVDRQSAYVGYGNPLTFGYLVRFDDDLGFNWYQDKAVHSGEGLFGGDFRTANNARLTWPVLHWLRLTGSVELEAKSRMLSAVERERALNLNFLQSEYATFLDRIVDPTRGLRFSLTLGNGGPLIQYGGFHLLKYRQNWVEAQTAQYYPLLSWVKLATRLDGGRFFDLGGTNSDRFFLGGSRSVRSYGYQELCPEKNAAGICVGEGQSLAYFLTSAEIRLEPFVFADPRGPLKRLVPLQIVPLADFAKVWDLNKGFAFSGDSAKAQPKGMGYAYGLGLRYPVLGIFNLRLDFVRGSGTRIFWLDLAQAF